MKKKEGKGKTNEPGQHATHLFLFDPFGAAAPTLTFCPTRKSCQVAVQTLKENGGFIVDSDHARKLATVAGTMQDEQLAAGVKKGVGFHHAGLCIQDRTSLEKLFQDGQLPVMACTSTLAAGVNLPAYLVMMKGTSVYRSQGMQEMGMAEAVQMCGRAGRPGFEVEGVAVTLTRQETMGKHSDLSLGQLPIESSMHLELAEHLNAEVALGTVQDIPTALVWLKETFFYVRAKQNPQHYGVSVSADLDQTLQTLALDAIAQLTNASAVSCNDEDMSAVSTLLGKQMAEWYMRMETVVIFADALRNGDALGMLDVINLASGATEFQSISLRTNEKKPLKALNEKHNKSTVVRCPVMNQKSGVIKTTGEKVAVLLQAAFANLDIASFQESTAAINQSAPRVVNFLLEMVLSREPSLVQAKTVTSVAQLAASIENEMWWDSKHLSQHAPAMHARFEPGGDAVVVEVDVANLDALDVDHRDIFVLVISLNGDPNSKAKVQNAECHKLKLKTGKFPMTFRTEIQQQFRTVSIRLVSPSVVGLDAALGPLKVPRQALDNGMDALCKDDVVLDVMAFLDSWGGHLALENAPSTAEELVGIAASLGDPVLALCQTLSELAGEEGVQVDDLDNVSTRERLRQLLALTCAVLDDRRDGALGKELERLVVAPNTKPDQGNKAMLQARVPARATPESCSSTLFRVRATAAAAATAHGPNANGTSNAGNASGRPKRTHDNVSRASPDGERASKRFGTPPAAGITGTGSFRTHIHVPPAVEEAGGPAIRACLLEKIGVTEEECARQNLEHEAQDLASERPVPSAHELVAEAKCINDRAAHAASQRAHAEGCSRNNVLLDRDGRPMLNEPCVCMMMAGTGLRPNVSAKNGSNSYVLDVKEDVIVTPELHQLFCSMQAGHALEKRDTAAMATKMALVATNVEAGASMDGACVQADSTESHQRFPGGGGGGYEHDEHLRERIAESPFFQAHGHVVVLKSERTTSATLAVLIYMRGVNFFLGHVKRVGMQNHGERDFVRVFVQNAQTHLAPADCPLCLRLRAGGEVPATCVQNHVQQPQQQQRVVVADSPVVTLCSTPHRFHWSQLAAVARASQTGAFRRTTADKASAPSAADAVEWAEKEAAASLVGRIEATRSQREQGNAAFLISMAGEEDKGWRMITESECWAYRQQKVKVGYSALRHGAEGRKVNKVNKKREKKEVMPFEDALLLARSLELKNKREWVVWCKSEARGANMPCDPRNAYKDDGWLGYGHWLGNM